MRHIHVRSSMFLWWDNAVLGNHPCFIISARYIQPDYQTIKIIALYTWTWTSRIVIPSLDYFITFLKSWIYLHRFRPLTPLSNLGESWRKHWQIIHGHYGVRSGLDTESWRQRRQAIKKARIVTELRADRKLRLQSGV